MNRLPYEVELNIWKCCHNLNMTQVTDELKREVEIFRYIMKSCFYPYLFVERLFVEKVITNPYMVQKISKYVHYKKFSKCLRYIIKPNHIIFE
jgi:hypothetical protein